MDHDHKSLDDFRSRAAEIATSIGQDKRHAKIYRRTIDSIDPAKVMKFQAKYADALTTAGLQSNLSPLPEKYADFPYWIAGQLPTTTTLNLDKRKSSDILDIGTGAAHFPAICQALGHRVVGIDVAYPLYEDACEVFGVDRRTMGVYARRPIPNLGKRFDIVTALALNFHYESGRGYWSLDDWSFFIKDLVANHLKSPGMIYLELNKRRYPDGIRFDEDLLRWAVDIGAVVDWERGIVTLSFPSANLSPPGGIATISDGARASRSGVLP